MCAYLYDERATQDAGAEFSPVAERLASAFQRDPLGADIFYRCAAADSLGDVVVRLAALLVPRGGRAVLRIVGHGSPGKVDVSKDRLTAESVWQMSPLAGQVQRIELHSCCVVASRENSYFDHRRTGGQFLPDFSPLADGDRDLAAYLRLGEIPSDVGRSIRGMRGVQLIAAMASTVRCAVRGAILTQVLDIREALRGPDGDGLSRRHAVPRRVCGRRGGHANPRQPAGHLCHSMTGGRLSIHPLNLTS